MEVDEGADRRPKQTAACKCGCERSITGKWPGESNDGYDEPDDTKPCAESLLDLRIHSRASLLRSTCCYYSGRRLRTGQEVGRLSQFVLIPCGMTHLLCGEPYHSGLG